MIAQSLKAKFLVFAIFFMGMAAGILVANFYTTRVTGSPDASKNDDRAQRDVNKFYDYLGLDEAQREQMHKIGEETRHAYQELRKETQPRFEAIQDESRAKIRAILNDEQRVKYDDFRRRMDERRKNRNREGIKNDRGADRGPQPD